MSQFCSGSADKIEVSAERFKGQKSLSFPLVCLPAARNDKNLPRFPLVKKIVIASSLALCSLLVVFVVARAADRSRRINLPTSKSLTLPGFRNIGCHHSTTSFPTSLPLEISA